MSMDKAVEREMRRVGSEDTHTPSGRSRPARPTDETVAAITDRLTAGETIWEICQDDPKMPTPGTWAAWVGRHTHVSDANFRARMARSELLVDWLESINKELWECRDHRRAQVLRVLADNLKWVISRTLPRYAAKQEHTVQGQVEHLHRQEHQIDVSRLTDEERQQLDALLAKVQLPDGETPALPEPGESGE